MDTPLPSAETIRAALAAAERIGPLGDDGTDDDADAEAGAGTPGESEFRVDTADVARTADAVWREIERGNNAKPWLFRHGGLLVRLARDDTGRLAPQLWSVDRARHDLARLVPWVRWSKTRKKFQPAYPGAVVVRDVLARHDPSAPALDQVVSCPTFASDGTLWLETGYCQATRLFHDLDGLDLPTVPDVPSDSQIAAARERIADLIGDFPFVSEAERTNAIAALLVPFVRPMLGSLPLFVIEKPEPGSGGTLLAEVLATVATGQPVPPVVEAEDEGEWRKRLMAQLRGAPQIIFIDNVKQRLASTSLACALTAQVVEDRVLGVSETVRLPVRAMVMCTGNNIQLADEMVRRCVRVRLDPGCPRPWQRTGFRHENLREFVRENRSGLVWAALVLVRSWVAAGMPPAERLPVLGGFERFCAVLAGVLEHAGFQGFLANAGELAAVADSETEAWRAFVAAWWCRLASGPSTVAELLPVAAEAGIDLGRSGNERAERVRLGQGLSRRRDRVFDVEVEPGYPFVVRLAAAGKRHGGVMGWKLVLMNS